MNIAIIPWNDTFLQDKIFGEVDPSINYDDRLTSFSRMKKEFERHGDKLHTVDLFDPFKVDFFLFFERNDEWLKKLANWNLEYKAVYCNAEPPVVNQMHEGDGIKELLNYFPYIMTWNRDLVDGKRIFKRNMPYCFRINIGTIPFKERKLLTSISGNKHSNHPKELYSERERVICAVEKYSPSDFDFYGGGWQKEGHPCYGGKVGDKAEVYHQYKFALAFENMKDVNGYVSEKILDCLTAGIVPIYKGADDISKYIPRNCFIPYDQFETPEQMIDLLKEIDEDKYNNFLDNAQIFLKSDKIKLFDGEEYARNVYYLIDHAGQKDFKITKKCKRKLTISVAKNRIKKYLGKWKHEMLGDWM